jgi:hypothetical protein
MTSANAIRRFDKHFGLCALFLAGLIGMSEDLHAQSTAPNGVNGTEQNGEAAALDRGKMRLKLLINLVENELNEARLKQSRLTSEASTLDQQQRSLLGGPAKGTEAEKRQIELIRQRLEQIDREVADVNARLPEISAELAELQARLDEANGIVREPETETAADDIAVDSASRWLDSKRQVQEALVYLGGYNGLIDGDFGPRTQAAVKVYQARQQAGQSGSLTNEQEAALLEEADRLRGRYGVTTIEDAAMGYRITYPSGLLKEEPSEEANLRRYVTSDGEGELLITSSGDADTVVLDALYDELIGDYDVEYRRNRNDWFVVAGPTEGDRIVYDTARLNGNRLIRAKLSYPTAWRDLWSPFAVIMFNSFEGLPAGES